MPQQIVVEFHRNSILESYHIADAVVVDSLGKTVEVFGNKDRYVFPRSAIKPIQALTYVLSEAYLLSPDQNKSIALACASHNAQDIHVDFLKQWHSKTGLDEKKLVCGPQPSDDKEVLYKLIRSGLNPSRIHNNCSGKHTAMLTTCLKKDWPTESYQNWDHPLQVWIREIFSQLSELDIDKAPWGIDGCGLPTYSIPLEAIAKAMSGFLKPERYNLELSSALQLVKEACAQEPWMISGRGYPCSEINSISNGSIFVKIGAEGNYIGLLYDKGLALALKVRDGAMRAGTAALYSLIERYSGLDPERLHKIQNICQPPIKNWAGETVGQISSSFKNC